VTKETAAGAEQSASAAEQLNRQAEGLKNIVGRFQLREKV
jgi:methyl-accepting chemotaxis protein